MESLVFIGVVLSGTMYIRQVSPDDPDIMEFVRSGELVHMAQESYELEELADYVLDVEKEFVE